MKKDIKRMLADIEMEANFVGSPLGRKACDPEIIEVMGKVPRDEFIPEEMKTYAFDNRPLPIGYGQTISQPYIVALMTGLLELKKTETVLEIGTGCGYQTAVLSLLAKKVFTIELVTELGEDSARRLTRLNHNNIEYRIGNGYEGWPEHAPYDGIIVTAAASHIPPALMDQLANRGRMVIPVGLPYRHQELMRVEKNTQGEITIQEVIGVAFVPLQEGISTNKSHPIFH